MGGGGGSGGGCELGSAVARFCIRQRSYYMNRCDVRLPRSLAGYRQAPLAHCVTIVMDSHWNHTLFSASGICSKFHFDRICCYKHLALCSKFHCDRICCCKRVAFWPNLITVQRYTAVLIATRLQFSVSLIRTNVGLNLFVVVFVMKAGIYLCFRLFSLTEFPVVKVYVVHLFPIYKCLCRALADCCTAF